MTASPATRTRYAAYAAAALLGVAAYAWTGVETPGVPAAAGRAHVQNAGLPALTFLDSGTSGALRRNLFAFGAPEVAVAVAPPPPPPPAPEPVKVETPAPVQPKVDLLAGVNVFGSVQRAGSAVVLVKIGPALRTITVGESFGADNALTVESVKGRYVKIADASSNRSKTFVLSED